MAKHIGAVCRALLTDTTSREFFNGKKEVYLGQLLSGPHIDRSVVIPQNGRELPTDVYVRLHEYIGDEFSARYLAPADEANIHGEAGNVFLVREWDWDRASPSRQTVENLELGSVPPVVFGAYRTSKGLAGALVPLGDLEIRKQMESSHTHVYDAFDPAFELFVSRFVDHPVSPRIAFVQNGSVDSFRKNVTEKGYQTVMLDRS